MGILKELKREFGTTNILVEKSVKAVLSLANHACVIERGEIVFQGTADEVRNDQSVRKAYFGQAKDVG